MYLLGTKSSENLRNVHARLVNTVHFAISITSRDFSVIEGVRSLKDEEVNIKNGHSKLKNPADCQHCLQKDGFGHAVDLAPYVDGKINWDWENIYPIAFAMRNAGNHLGVRIRWGGVWDKCLNDLSNDMKKEVEDYKVRHNGSDFLDGPHFEIHKSDLIFQTNGDKNGALTV